MFFYLVFEKVLYEFGFIWVDNSNDAHLILSLRMCFNNSASQKSTEVTAVQKS